MNRDLQWLNGKGPFSDVVVSSRIRLARNFVKVPFPHRASESEIVGLMKKVIDVIEQEAMLKNMDIFYMDRMSDIGRRLLVESHIISPEQAMNTVGRAVVVDDKGIVSIMINEEDHLRFQCFLSGLQLSDSWRIIARVEGIVGKHIEYAFDSQLGFLTAWPTNVGTGMRASVMVHLPAFVISGRIGNLINSVGKIGVTIRGVYGEGSASLGDIFQISNQITLGPTEEEIVDSIERVTRFVYDEEMKIREDLLKKDKVLVEDKVWRALGILSNARSISIREASSLLSLVRMGVSMGILPGIEIGVLNMLFISMQPAHLIFRDGRQNLFFEDGTNLGEDDLDIKRASVMREVMKNV